MKPQEQLEQIKKHFKNMNNFGWPEDVRWLVARINQLEQVLRKLDENAERYQLQCDCGDMAARALHTGPEPVENETIKGEK